MVLYYSRSAAPPAGNCYHQFQVHIGLAYLRCLWFKGPPHPIAMSQVVILWPHPLARLIVTHGRSLIPWPVVQVHVSSALGPPIRTRLQLHQAGPEVDVSKLTITPPSHILKGWAKEKQDHICFHIFLFTAINKVFKAWQKFNDNKIKIFPVP